MDSRALSSVGGQQRPRPPRAVSGGSYGSSTLPKRPPMPSRLSTVRSFTQPVNVVDLTEDGLKSESRNGLAFLRNSQTPRTLVQSPDVIRIEDDDEAPPAKRLKTSGSELRSEGERSDSDTVDKAHELIPGSALPDLPFARPTTNRAAGTRHHRLGIDPSARKAHGLDPPHAATRASLPPRNVLDFSPWTGKPNTHAEDTLNDTVIKAGFFDKGQGPNQTDTNSARTSIWPAINQKNQGALFMIGHLFGHVMEKRQSMAKCTAPSTFKPPPRVTVTDSKREAWLRDLANSEVPLRKQSRTIPHGIRGKALLDQCLGKDIPLHRAVWLTKCVGANELRAFRRKGVSGSAAASGEAKWVREWTLSVEQFLESVLVTGSQQQEWRKNANYAIKLVSALYVEKLLDTAHFLDWIVTSLAQASTETLPVWIAVVQIYWKGLTKYAQRGRRLASSILEHLHRITEMRVDVHAPLKVRLQKLVIVLAVSNRGCLIIPNVWERYKYLLSPKEGARDAISVPAKNITERNERLAAPPSKTAPRHRDPTSDLYAVLDALELQSDQSGLAEKCLACLLDINTLVSAILDWASTPYRVGEARIYRASNIIAQLSLLGHDTDAAILQYMRDIGDVGQNCVQFILKVIVDLIRLESFSVGRYLQWLITSGALSTANIGSCAIQLIAALPLKGLALQVQNTRKTLLRRTGYEINEQATVEAALARIDTALFEDASWQFDPAILPNGMTRSSELALSQQVCTRTIAIAKDVGLSLHSFVLARDVLECLEDLPSLATLISTGSSSMESALLATTCDTVYLHSESLAARGQLQELLDGLAEQYITLRSQQPADRTFILALSNLARVVPGKASLVKLLREDLAICEQQSSSAVCSPASDSLIGMQATSLNSDDDINAVFASGNTMDQQLMQRVFTRVIQRAGKPASLSEQGTSRVVGWLKQMQAIDAGSGVFSQLVNTYLQSTLSGSSENSISSSAIAALAISGSSTLGVIAELAKDNTSPSSANTILHVLISSESVGSGLTRCEQYNFRLLKEQCESENTDSLIAVMRTACNALEFDPESPDLIRFVVRCVSTRPGCVRAVFVHGTDHSKLLRSNASRIVIRILQLGEGIRSSNAPAKDFDVQALVRMANTFSVGYCVEAIHYLKAKADWSAQDEQVLEQAILESFGTRSDVWVQLLGSTEQDTKVAIHAWARDQMLDMASHSHEFGHEDAPDHLERCQQLLAVTSPAATRSEDLAALGAVSSKLREIEMKIVHGSDVKRGPETQPSNDLAQLRIILHLSAMHIHRIESESEASKSVRLDMLGLLCSLLVLPKLQLYKDITEYLFDLASTLAASLSDCTDSVVKLPVGIKLPQDGRLDFIFGSETESAQTWLALAYQDKPQGSQQQRALARHSSQQSLRSPMPSSQPQQQSSSHPQHGRWPSSSGQPGLMRQDGRIAPDIKTTPYHPRHWEVFSDPTPVMGENDGSLSLGLFGARKV